MRINNLDLGATAGATPARAVPDNDPIRQFVAGLPRPFRFLGVGGLGLLTDLAVFTVLIGHGLHPLQARIGSLAVATVVTWRLNRALTFDRSGRRPSDEALRYAAVAAGSQTVSYAVFAVLVISVAARVPQLAVLIGAATGAIFSYTGQALFAFRPHRSAAAPSGGEATQ